MAIAQCTMIAIVAVLALLPPCQSVADISSAREASRGDALRGRMEVDVATMDVRGMARSAARRSLSQTGPKIALASRITYAGQPALLFADSGGVVGLESPSTAAYNLKRPESTYYSQWGQDHKLWEPVLARIDALREQGYKPFFVESGALEGEGDSNTLFLEKSQHWQGLLVEPSNKNFPHLHEKHRKAWAFHGAISPTTGSAKLQFLDSGNGESGIKGISEPSATPTEMYTQAEPLVGLLGRIQPAKKLVVDFWSLDIEGSEGAVLESTDFSQVQVGVLMIEMNKGDENNARVRKVMQANSFQEIGGTKYDGPTSLDRVFVNPKYFEERRLDVPRPFGEV